MGSRSAYYARLQAQRASKGGKRARFRAEAHEAIRREKATKKRTRDRKARRLGIGSRS